MMLRWCLLLAVSCVAAQEGEKKESCFKKLGCFSNDEPWSSPARPLPPPENPDTLEISMNFYSRPDADKQTVVKVYPKIIMNRAPFKKAREKTFIIISSLGQHGMWPEHLKNVLLYRVDANVFVMNVTRAFRGLDAFQSASNARVVGAEIALMLKHLRDNLGQDLKNVHLIGVGLGAHVAAYASKRYHVGRITGLDPMQEFFEGYPNEVHLVSTDADFVDVIHADARPIIPGLGVGFLSPIGTVDLYLNGGTGQPGCFLPRPSEFNTTGTGPDIVREITRFIITTAFCSHQRSYKVFIEAVNNTDCTFWGHPGTKENFLRSVSNGASQGILTTFTALTEPCTVDKCVPIGLETPSSPLKGIFIVTTAAEAPFCVDKKKSVLSSITGEKSLNFGKWINGFVGDNKE